MPPSTNYTEFSNSGQEVVTEAETIIESLEPFFPKIDDDLAYLKENENRINELEAIIAKSRAEINVLKRQANKRRQIIKDKLNLIIETVKLHSQNEEVIRVCNDLLFSRFEQFPKKSSNIYKSVNNTKKTGN